MNLVSFVLGDPSHDGHGKTETFLFYTDRTITQLRDLNDKVNEVLGFNFIGLFDCYEDNNISVSVYEQIKELTGYSLKYVNMDEDVIYLNSYDFMEILVELFFYVDKDLSLTQVKPLSFTNSSLDEKQRTIYEMGYGFFT